MSNLKFNVIASVASLMLGASQIAMADDSALYNRAAVGDITLNGGASRVHADLTKLYADEDSYKKCNFVNWRWYGR